MELQQVVDKFQELNDKYLQGKYHLLITDDINKFGYCQRNKKIIGISMYHCKLNPDYNIIRTLVHEVAHALTPYHSHDYFWRIKFEELIYKELGVIEKVESRFGKGKLPSVAERKKSNHFEFKL